MLLLRYCLNLLSKEERLQNQSITCNMLNAGIFLIKLTQAELSRHFCSVTVCLQGMTHVSAHFDDKLNEINILVSCHYNI